SDSTSATTPRTIGSRQARWRLIQGSKLSTWTSISPSATAGSPLPPATSSATSAASGAGFRTATAQVEPPRIITPSSTAWPPTGVHELLPAGVERVAFRADLDVQLRLCGARSELVAAGAADVGHYILGVDALLHEPHSSGGQEPLMGRWFARAHGATEHHANVV